jgi:rare lipoprotein A
MKGRMMLIKKLFALLMVSIAILICAGCRTLPQSPTSEEHVSQPVTAETAAPEAPEPAPPQSLVGTARYYASRFHGRKTASGEIYNQKKMTAAHESLPFGTLVKVENLANYKSVIVKVNDRCRKHEEVFIDLSREAALELGFIRQGTAKVRLTVLHNPHNAGTSQARE